MDITSAIVNAYMLNILASFKGITLDSISLLAEILHIFQIIVSADSNAVINNGYYYKFNVLL